MLAAMAATWASVWVRARKERPGFAPIGAVIILHYAERSWFFPRLEARFPPFWGVANPIRRVGDHKVRLDAAEHALDVRRDRRAPWRGPRSGHRPRPPASASSSPTP